MRKSEKTEGTITLPGAAEDTAPEKPKRGRKPGTGRKKGNPEDITGKESESVPEDTAEKEPGRVPEETAGEGSAAAPEEAAGKEDEPVPEESTKESLESVPEKSAEEALPVEKPAAAPPVQVVESPLRLMKQEFQQRSQVIREQMRNIQNAFITIGFQLHWIRENNMFRVLNYRNIYEYAEKEYGIKKTSCCNFICIIENYAERDENGNVIESIADCYRNYSASQLVAMLGMTEEMKQQVTPDMSVRAINRLRKGEPENVVEEASPVKEALPEKEENPVEETVPAREESPEPTAMEENAAVQGEAPREEEIPVSEPEKEIPEEKQEEAKDTDGWEPVKKGALPEELQEAALHPVPDTLAEIGSYYDYRSMAERLDEMMRKVFATRESVRVRIVCVQG